jgi:hypothetical protein
MKTRTATCSCGQLTIETKGDPVRVSVCHCLACQKRTGSAFGAQARWAEENAVTSGRHTTYVRRADTGNGVSFHFCPDCGSTVFYRLDALPGFVAVPLGAFADPTFPQPTVAIYEARRHGWVNLPDAVERMD